VGEHRLRQMRLAIRFQQFRQRLGPLRGVGRAGASARMRSCSALETVMALPLRLSDSAVTIGTAMPSRPSVAAIGIGASICAASSTPIATLSRSAAQARSTRSSTSRPCRGEEAARLGDDDGRGVRQRQQSQAQRGLLQFIAHHSTSAAVISTRAKSPILCLRSIAMRRSRPIGGRLVEAASFHQQSLGFFDIALVGQPRARLIEFLAQCLVQFRSGRWPLPSAS